MLYKVDIHIKAAPLFFIYNENKLVCYNRHFYNQGKQSSNRGKNNRLILGCRIACK